MEDRADLVTVVGFDKAAAFQIENASRLEVAEEYRVIHVSVGIHLSPLNGDRDDDRISGEEIFAHGRDSQLDD